jgi:tetratricopeptide (TPR) repeat protein
MADPEFSEGQAAMALAQGWSEYKWAEAVSRADTAVRLNPASARAHVWRSQVLLPLGRSLESLESAQRAVELDPLFILYRQISAERLLFRRAYERAAEQALQMLELDPESPSAHCILGKAYSWMGRHDEAVALLERVCRWPRAIIFMWDS